MRIPRGPHCGRAISLQASYRWLLGTDGGGHRIHRFRETVVEGI
jgi:hypothetical protein